MQKEQKENPAIKKEESRRLDSGTAPFMSQRRQNPRGRPKRRFRNVRRVEWRNELTEDMRSFSLYR